MDRRFSLVFFKDTLFTDTFRDNFINVNPNLGGSKKGEREGGGARNYNFILFGLTLIFIKTTHGKYFALIICLVVEIY